MPDRRDEPRTTGVPAPGDETPGNEGLGRPGPDEAAAGGALHDPQLEGDLAAELELAREQAAAHLESAQRLQAEFENYRKRVAREAEEMRARSTQRLVEELLPVIDNLERAIDHSAAGGDVERFVAGVRMVHAQVIDVLGKEGVSVQAPLGEPFDPVRHQAVGQREDPDAPDHTVLDVYQKGYEMAGKVIRPAMVVVSTGGPAGPEE